MLTVGVDLAAEPKKTAVAVLEWGGGAASVRSIELGLADAAIVARSVGAATVGIDCAFGWPLEFVAFVAAHARHEVAPRELAGADWRRRLAYRETDRVVHEYAAKWPLSVSTDRLGLTAMHCAELLDAFAAAGESVDRSGGGRLLEAYPGAALKVWGVATLRYKIDADARAAALADLQRLAPWLEIPAVLRALMVTSDDAFDAVVASLNARAHALGLTLPVPPELLDIARSEGWIALPTGPLGALA